MATSFDVLFESCLNSELWSLTFYSLSKTLFLQSFDIVTRGGADDTVTSDFITVFALTLCTRLLLLFFPSPIYSEGKQNT